MTSARIELAGPKFWESAIDRVKPSVLQPHLQDHEWDNFCNDVDKAMVPINRACKIQMGCIALACLCMIISMITIYNFGPDMTIFSIPMICVVVLVLAPQLYASVVTSTVKASIQQICEDISQRHPQVSFHVRYDVHYYRRSNGSSGSSTTTYIEASVNDKDKEGQLGPQLMEAATATAIPMGNVDIELTSSLSSPTAARLSALDKIKYQLTDQEYDAKRAEILSSV